MKRYIKAAVEQFSAMPNPQLEELVRSSMTSPRDLVAILNYAESPEGHEQLDYLWQRSIVQGVLMNRNTPEEILRKYWDKGVSDDILAVCMNPSVPKDLLLKYVSHPGSRSEVALNPNLPEEAVQIILNRKYYTKESRDGWVQRLAKNPSVSMDIRKQIANDYPNKETGFEIYLDHAISTQDRDVIADTAEQLITSQGYKYNGIDGEDICLYIFSSWIPSEADADTVLVTLVDTLEALGYSVTDNFYGDL